MNDELTAQTLGQRLRTEQIGCQAYLYPVLPSTMDRARELAEAGAPEGTLVLAEEQTAGRGRMGRSWWAPAGTALLLSLLFRPPLAPTQVQRLTMVCSLALCDAIADQTGLEARVKWPNDVLIEGKKVCGMLTELEFDGARLRYVIVGMGINVNVDFRHAPPLMAPATSLMEQLGHPVSRLDLLVALLEQIEIRYNALRAGHSPHREWAQRMETLGRRVTVSSGDERIEGIAEDVDPDGALLVRTDEGVLHTILAGDVTLRT